MKHIVKNGEFIRKEYNSEEELIENCKELFRWGQEEFLHIYSEDNELLGSLDYGRGGLLIRLHKDETWIKK